MGINKKLLPDEEVVIKEHPKFTYCWEEGEKVRGGNLILTNKRLLFLNPVMLDEKKIERWRKLVEGGTTTEQLEFSISLHKKNFQIPLPLITSVKHVWRFAFPFPSLRMEITYRSPKKKEKVLTFQFKQIFLRILFQRGLPLTTEWIKDIRQATKNREVFLS